MATSTRTAAPSNGQPAGAPTQDVGMDSLVIQAAHTQNRFVPGMEAVRLAGALARRPTKVAGRLRRLAGDAGAIVAGTSERGPARGDKRFADPAWERNWLFRRLLQGYLAADDLTHGLIEDAQLESDVDHRLHFVAGNVLDALAPTNFPWSNPAALKAAIDSGGENFRVGAQALLRDARSPQKIPANVDRTPFKVGENLAATPGAVVERHEMYELIQYAPTTEEVRTAPLVIVPPMISKFYVVDLAPGKSLVEYLVAHGQQVFAISWRNPTAGDAAWDLDAYAAAIIDAVATARSVTGADRVHLSALCAGGVATAATLGHLAHVGKLDQVASVTLNVTTLDTRRAGTIGNFVSPDTAAAAVKNVERKGYLDRNQLLRTFAWLRPNDMIWSYWVNNYLMGKKPPAFDLLFWNADTMDMPAGLHRDFVNIGLHNPFLTPGEETILGSPIDLAEVDCDNYIVAGETDHITPWPNCYVSTRLLGGESRFVLSNGGHIAAVINPPGNPKARYRAAPGDALDGKAWARELEPVTGTWWEDWDAWLAERSDGLKPAPKKLGSRKFTPVADAPGEYVLA
ncbi:MAG TPA: alpha/beta fold hydrolase [Solirubrobacteraceae bacterium]